MKKFILYSIFFLVFTDVYSQKWKKIEIEPFVNPLLVNLEPSENYIISIYEPNTSTSFINRPTSELGFNINYRFKKNFFGGIGMSWWKRNYDFTISISETVFNNFYLTNQQREININNQSLKLFVGYEFKFNSSIKFEYSIGTSIIESHNVPDRQFGLYYLSSTGFNWREQERVNDNFFYTLLV